MNYLNDAVEFYFNAAQVMINLQRGLVEMAVEKTSKQYSGFESFFAPLCAKKAK